MGTLSTILASVFLVSVVSLAGVVFIGMSDKFLRKVLFVLIAFAAGALLGASFLELMPEAIEKSQANVLGYVLLGIVLFFILERFIFWHHCHDGKCSAHTFTYLNFIGDGIHNFIDGAAIAASYMASFELGAATTIAIFFHEVPQEIGDFGILVYGGFSRRKALLYNFLSASTAFAGAILAYFLTSAVENLLAILIAIAAGSFIYIASADLLPELKKEIDVRTSILQLAFFIAGMGVLWSVRFVF